MDCTMVKLYLEPLEKGQLDSKRKKGMEEHLAQCRKCCQELEETQAVNALLDEIEIPKLPKDFTVNIMEKISNLNTGTKNTTNHWQDIRKWGISLVAAGFIMLVLNFTSLGTTIATLSTNLEQTSINFSKIIEYSPGSLLNKGFEQLNLYMEDIENRG